jgi:hypothetical protein
MVGVAMLVAACGGGGGGGGSTAPAATTAQAEGSVNAVEIGGTGLNVLSAQQATTADVKNGAFTTTVSTQGPQLLFLQDSAGKIRGLTLSLPSNSSTASIMAADAKSTALALLFLSPGITTSNSAQAKQVFTALQQMTSFAQFLAFLQANLPTRALDDLVQNVTYQSLLTACLTEWPGVVVTLPPVPVASLNPLAFAVEPEVTPASTSTANIQSGGVTLEVTPGYTGALDLQATLSNYALRSVMVYEVLDDGTSQSLVTSFRLDGAKALKLTSWLTGSIGAPTTYTVKTSFPNANSKLQYSIVGMGLWSTTGTLPPGFSSSDLLYPVVKDDLNYVVLPMLDFVTGLPLSTTFDIGTAVTGLVQNQSISTTAGQFVALATTGMAAATAAQAVATLTNQTLGQVVTILGNQVANLAVVKATTLVSLVMKAENFVNYVDNLLTLPGVAVIHETSPYDAIQFANSSYCAQQTDGKINITVTRNDGSNDPATVNYTIDGTAIAYQDYIDASGTPGTLKFANKQTEATIPITILKNPSTTAQRDVTVSLGEIDGLGKVGTPSTTTLTIRPDFSGTYTRSFDLGDSSRESYVISGDTVTGSRRRWFDDASLGYYRSEIDMQISGTLQPAAPGACSVKITGQSSYTFTNLFSGYVEMQIRPFTGGVDSPGRFWWVADLPTSPYPFGNIGGLACTYAQCF